MGRAGERAGTADRVSFEGVAAPASGVASDVPGSGSRPASSERLCPGCAKPVDALRAGHVAIYDGLFLYYCNATCKALHLRSIAAHLGEDVPTLDPPAVAERFLAHAATIPAGMGPFVGGEANGGRGQASFESNGHAGVVEPGFIEPAIASAVENSVAPATEVAPPALVAVPGPATLRSPPLAVMTTVSESPASGERVRAPKATSKERTRSVASAVGLVAGALVPLLAIADVGLGARLAFAVIAAGAFFVRLAVVPRDLADASPLVVAAPVLFSAAVAAASYAAGDPRAAAITVLAGLSASVAVAVEEAVARARAGVDAARARIRTALDVPSRVVRAGGAAEIAFEVKSGETVLLEAGDVVGVDGRVSSGEAVVVPWHEASVEMDKREGDSIIAGARVVSGRLRVVTSWAGSERAWARSTTSMAVRADVSGPVARTVRALFERLTPAVAVVAALAAFASGGAAGWLEAVAAACAVALAFSARSVVAAAALVHGKAQMQALAHGIVYKDAKTFDAAGRTATAVACSRGTVLTGEPEIVALEQVGESGVSESRILALAAGAETASTHPLATAILRAARTRRVQPEAVRSATIHAGLGITALVSSGDRLVVGSRALLLQEQVSVAIAEARASELEAQGRSVLLVALAGKLVGLLGLQDGLRAGARAAVQRLLDARIEPVLLSGESRETCETIARALEIDHVRPEVLPADRGAEVRALSEGGHVVAVIGHPASDDGALGAADVAVAMGAPSGPGTGEWGVWLASDDMRDAALALSTAHAARDRARAVVAAGLAPGVVALLALAFGIGPLVCGPLALAVGAALCLAIARRG